MIAAFRPARAGEPEFSGGTVHECGQLMGRGFVRILIELRLLAAEGLVFAPPRLLLTSCFAGNELRRSRVHSEAELAKKSTERQVQSCHPRTSGSTATKPHVGCAEARDFRRQLGYG
jgi:hypothetical protein